MSITPPPPLQRGLKETAHKPLGRHYPGATRNGMSFAVRPLTQVKVRNHYFGNGCR
jgi:hypothetical protein